MATEISKEQYDEWAEQIKSGKCVHAKGRRAATLDELDFLVAAEDLDDHRWSELPMQEMAVPQILGLIDQNENDRLREENDGLREQNTQLTDENAALKGDLKIASAAKPEVDAPAAPSGGKKVPEAKKPSDTTADKAAQ